MKEEQVPNEQATGIDKLIAHTPEPPYYAVIFTSIRNEGDRGYKAMTRRMLELAREQPGFLGVESAREELGITVSYWESPQAIRHWKEHMDHQLAQARGRAFWYKAFSARIARVDRAYHFQKS